MTSSENNFSMTMHLDPVHDALEFLDKLSPENYSADSEGPFASSIGAHMRHILDHYQALILGFPAGYLDYTNRARESVVESDMTLAQESWLQIKSWLNALSADSLSTSLNVMTEHGLVSSSLARELSFVSSHSVHHFAFMKQLTHNLNIDMSNDVGIAPATLKNLREQAAKN